MKARMPRARGRNRRRKTEGEARSFPPIFGPDAQVLILGSMPGIESLRRRQYYAHPRNAFWPIMGALFGAGPELPYARRVARLRAARVAVWDVLARCRRAGSLDTAIAPKSARPNNLESLLRRAPRLRVVFFNGGAAEYWFRRCFGNRLDRPPFAGRRYGRLPSTSPAHAGRSFEEKLAIWRKALAPFGGGAGSKLPVSIAARAFAALRMPLPTAAPTPDSASSKSADSKSRYSVVQ